MQELIKYFEALEARLAAQEERIAALEKIVNSSLPMLTQMQENSEALKQQMTQMQQLLDEAIKRQQEPEVEVDLVYPEDEEVTVELPQEELDLSTEPTEQTEVPAPEPEPVVEPEPEPEPVVEPEPEPVVEPVVEEPAPVVEVAPEPAPAHQVEEPKAEAPKPEAPRAPQQTSLFGAPVTDIRQAVSIGDRFLFQRELFGGNAEKLQQTLAELNALNSLDEALAQVATYGWDRQSPTYELFINVLHRRFQ